MRYNSIPYIFLFSILLIFTISCQKEENSVAPESNNNTPPTHHIGDTACTFDTVLYSGGNVLTSTQLDDYFTIWKEIFMARNGLDKNTFSNYVIKTEKSSNTWSQGISFRVDYLVKIDWAIIRSHDSFLVLKDSASSSYNYLNIPTNVLFNQSQIHFNLSKEVYSEISHFNLFKPLFFRNCEEACMHVRNQSGYQYVFSQGLDFYVPGNIPRENGDLYLMLYGDVDISKNKCLRGHINLMTGQYKIEEYPCMVY